MKIHNTFCIGREEKLRNNKKLCKTRRYRHFTFIIISVLLLLIYACVLKSVNLKKQVINVNDKKYENFRKNFNGKIFLRGSSIAKGNTELLKHHITKRQRGQNTNEFEKIFYKINQKKTVGLTDSHKEARNFKMSKKKRLKRNTELKKTTQTQIDNFAAVYLTYPVNRYAAAIKCLEYQNNCTLACEDGSVSFLDDNINYFKPKCPNIDLSLMLAKCEFNFGILQQSFFYSASKMALLSINGCNLQTIKETAFQHQNAQSLQTLILINNQLLTLKDNTFDGLNNLLRIEFVQNSLSTIFKGEVFFKPLAKTLKEAIIQPSVNGSVINDPLNWWLSLQMNFLTKLDLSNTNLQGILNAKTFQPFEQLEELILFNCNLLSIEADTFDFITNKFKYLNLQYNHLKILGNELLQKILIPNLEVDLNLNDWLCECEGEMVQNFANNDVSLSEGLICSSPVKWQHMTLKQVIKECAKDEATEETTAISSRVTISTTLPQEITSAEEKTITSTSSSVPASSATDTTLTEVSTMTITTIETFTTIDLPTTENDPPQASWINILTLNIISNSSLTITVKAHTILPHFCIIYFTNYTNYNYISDVKETNYIKDLKPSTAYVFCLIVKPTLLISPFECQTVFMGMEAQQKIWLLESDKKWFISLTSVLTISLFTVSIFITCKLLHHKPHWLLKHNRIVPKVFYRSGEDLISTWNSSMKCQSPDSLHYLSSLPPNQIANNNDARIAVYNSQHVVPLTTAPSVNFSKKSVNTSRLSGTKCRTALSRCTQLNTDYLDVIEDDPDYETINCYEEINI